MVQDQMTQLEVEGFEIRARIRSAESSGGVKLSASAANASAVTAANPNDERLELSIKGADILKQVLLASLAYDYNASVVLCWSVFKSAKNIFYSKNAPCYYNIYNKNICL
jgi:hypothetical protein